MGNKLASQTPQLDYYLHDLPGIVIEQSLGNSRFLKAIKCVHDEGPVVVKVYVKRPPQNDLKEYADQLRRIRDSLHSLSPCNVFPITKFVETEKAGYLIRQYFVNNLHDRIGTRPFLTLVEKQWITFQLLHAVHSVHSLAIYHGDIKCENVMVTSWNWVYLTDFAGPYKPTYIPEDSPSDFSFFFDTSGRRACYLAPERLTSSKTSTDGEALTAEMDIFSLGCVIAELFLDGSPRTIFSLAQLLSYRKGEYDPSRAIDRIECDEIKLLIKMMIDMDPSKRKSAAWYLEQWADIGLPPYFGKLHNYVASLMEISADEKIFNIEANFSQLLAEMHAAYDEETGGMAADGKEKKTAAELLASKEKEEQQEMVKEQEKHIPLGLPPNYAEEFLKASAELSQASDDMSLLLQAERFVQELEKEAAGEVATKEVKAVAEEMTEEQEEARSPVKLGEDLPAPQPVLMRGPRKGGEGMTIILTMICSCIHSVTSPTIRITALELFLRVAEHLDDRCRLARIVPYIVSLLHDEAALIRSFAISALTKVLRMVTSFPPSDSHVFTEYIMPSLALVPADKDIIVRNTFAQNLGLLAEVARRFLEAAQLYKQSDSLSIASADTDSLRFNAQRGYDAELDELQNVFYQVIATMFAKDCPSSAKLALLTDIDRLAYFFGRDKSVDQLLPLIVTFLNDQSWELRCAFFEHIVGICSFVGVASLEQFIYPCILQAMTDREEFVIAKAASLLSSLCGMGLFRKFMMYEIVAKTLPMLLHPNTWVRYAVISVIGKVAGQLDRCDVYCFLVPHVRPYLVGDYDDVTESVLLDGLRPPIARQSLERAVALCSEALQKFSKVQAGRHKQTSSSGSVAGSAPVGYDSDDPFVRFMRDEFTNSGLKGEVEVLLLMLPYIKEATRGVHRLEAEKRSGKGGADPELEEFAGLSQTIPVHSVDLLKAGDARSVEELVASDAEWRYLAYAADPMKSQPMAADGRTSVTLDLQSSVKTVKQLMVPPKLPKLGTLRRVSDAAALPCTGESLADWKPKGLLVASLHEHKKAVTHIEVANDNLFFVTASRDDTLKIWDSTRLETNVTNRSRLTYRLPASSGSPSSLTILENTHSVAVGLESGLVKIFRVEYVVHPKYLQYTACEAVFDDHDMGSAVVGLEHYDKDVQSLLVAATSQGKVKGLDLRTGRQAFEMDNTARSGLITSMIIEPSRNWLVVGTSLGCYTCWDIRFNIPLAQWWHPREDKRIHRLGYHANKLGGSSCIYAAVGNGDIFLWDVESASCVCVWQTSGTEKVESLRPQAQPSKQAIEFSTSIARPADGKDRSQRALYVPKFSNGIFAAGGDRTIRYWDMTNVHKSYRLGKEADTHVKYVQTRIDGAEVYKEVPVKNGAPSQAGKKSLPQSSRQHLDCIMDMDVLEQPINMLVTGARDGVVKVWK